jgi:hypothetical protein
LRFPLEAEANGAAFLIAACMHWKPGDQIQAGFRVEEVPAAEVVSEMRKLPTRSVVSKNPE